VIRGLNRALATRRHVSEAEMSAGEGETAANLSCATSMAARGGGGANARSGRSTGEKDLAPKTEVRIGGDNEKWGTESDYDGVDEVLGV
jgi:hypothetical protein